MVPNSREHQRPAVYRWTNTINGRFYIGSSKNVYKRYHQYLSRYRNPKHKEYKRALSTAMREVGIEKFEFSIVEWVSPDQQLVREQHWLDTTNVCDPLIGYNVKPKTDSWIAYNLSSESRALLSASSTRRMADPVFRELTLAAIRKHRPKCIQACKTLFSRAVYQIDRESLSIVSSFSSATAASLAFGPKDPARICRVCNRRTKSAFGYYWIYQEDYEKTGFQRPVPRSMVNRGVPIGQFNLDEELIKVWPSAKVISNELGFTRTVINACASGKSSTYQGFIWRYLPKS